ncbi:HD domain-containing protein [Aliiglaciecola sp. M165]|uniref:HD domain-containing protein n=1 Tax=Aliiglaciecola sp. M165 TaxID=2593649 RepID=UPI00117C9C73|nr:HD domain-containing protein [Aliiglaciecola sp. M165]TRY33233.1 HD domain-containing protein [Aliiglaciecola sp. M165]
MEHFTQQVDFILELDRLKAVYRKTTVRDDNNRHENSAEHSWHIALLAQVLSEYAEHDIDLNRVVTMLLIHDIVEIDAGDMFAFAQQQDHEIQEQKELAAAERIFGLLPETQKAIYLSLWLEFEQATSHDAQFAKAIDRVLPVFQNMNNQGGSWLKHGVTKTQVIKRNEYMKTSGPKLWQYVLEQIDIATQKGWLKDE